MNEVTTIVILTYFTLYAFGTFFNPNIYVMK